MMLGKGHDHDPSSDIIDKPTALALVPIAVLWQATPTSEIVIRNDPAIPLPQIVAPHFARRPRWQTKPVLAGNIALAPAAIMSCPWPA
jgi:hypothetical protein